MKLEDQVLSLEQVQELQELGFDFRKYSSACVIEAKDRNKYIVDRRLIGLHIGFMETEVVEYHETLTIGDIIDVLPETIITKYWGKYIRSHIEINKKVVCYPCYDKNGEVMIMLFHSMQENLIDSLFDCLVWCIKEKHIKL